MKKKNKYFIPIILLLLLFIGYAYANSTFKINGTAVINKNTWSIHWDGESINVSTGSVTASIPEVTDEDETILEFAVNLHKPKDYYEFTIDAVNEGSIDGMISKIEYKLYENGQEIEIPKYLEYKITYMDGKELKENYLIKANTSERYKIKVLYKNDVDASELPKNQKDYTSEVIIDTKQPDKDAVDRETPTTLLTGKEVNKNIKNLVNSQATSDTVNLTITKIKRSRTKPASNVNTKNNLN